MLTVLHQNPDLDGGPLGWRNCFCTCTAMQIAFETNGAKHPSGGDVRRCCLNPNGTRDITGGTNIDQNIQAAMRCWGVRLDYRQVSFEQAWTWGQKLTMSVSISISYRPVSGTRFDASPGFVGNHQIILSGGKVYDPLADGRRAGIPQSPQVWPKSLLRTAAGRVNIAAPGHPYRALGEGTAICVLAYAPVAKPTKYSVAFEPGAFFTYRYMGAIWLRERDEGFSKNTSAPCTSPETIPWLDGRKRVVQITAGRLNGLRVEPGATHLKLLEKK